MLYWIILVLSGMFETVWALALSASEGFTKPLPATIFVIAAIISLGLLAIAARRIPIGTAYGIFAGIGAVGTVLVAVVTGQQSLSLVGWLCILAIIGAIVGLKLTTPSGADDAKAGAGDADAGAADAGAAAS